jgi:hypothetical protein
MTTSLCLIYHYVLASHIGVSEIEPPRVYSYGQCATTDSIDCRLSIIEYRLCSVVYLEEISTGCNVSLYVLGIVSYLPHTRVKAEVFVCLTKYHAMKTYGGSGGIASRILYLDTRRR